ncbi:hypothetical protein DPMN_016532 [Dreissena polymorpha]|uniref:Uncharacterized protein n=1 Tax=Dreissena polymorpha TaxID=45954 RepID=A0A9D4NEZ7_DREPO|nr:hypothetical protein DPMN_016532 [Dreissena polymorpha]
MADKLSAMLKSKMMALNASVAAAEKAAKEHVWNNNIQIGDFFTLKSKDIKDNDTGLEYSERFKQYIIPNMSSVHIPVEIYDGVSTRLRLILQDYWIKGIAVVVVVVDCNIIRVQCPSFDRKCCKNTLGQKGWVVMQLNCPSFSCSLTCTAVRGFGRAEQGALRLKPSWSTDYLIKRKQKSSALPWGS